MTKITNTPEEWSNPFGLWFAQLQAKNPEFFRFTNSKPIKKIHVVDDNITYHRVVTPDGSRFIAEDKLRTAEVLGLSVRGS